MDKRGQGIQFNWIFVIVSGAIILSFFAVFTFKYIELQEEKQSVEASRSFVNMLFYLEGSYVGKGLAIDSTSNFSFKLNYFTTLDVNCEGERSSVIIAEQPLSEIKLQDEIVFAPKNMRVNSMDTWVEPWYYPYYVSNFIFLSKPEKKIYIKYDQTTKDIAKDLNINEWEEFDTTLVSSGTEIKSSNDLTVLWISTQGPELTLLNKLKNNASSFTFIQAIPNFQNEEYISGKLIFYEGKQKLETKFYGEALLHAAIFSGGYTEYTCGLNRSMKRLSKTSEVLTQKTDLLFRLPQSEECRTLYVELRSRLKEFSVLKNLETAEIIMNDNSKLIGRGCALVF